MPSRRVPRIGVLLAIVALVVGLALTRSGGIGGAAPGPAPGGARLAAAPQPGERAIIVLKDRFDPRTVASQAGVTPTRVYQHVLNGFVARLPAAAITALQRNPHVAIISADLPIHAAAQTLPTGVDRIDADQNPTANIGSGGSVNADVAVLDTGVDASHPDLNVAGGTGCTSTGSYADDNGHGTHVSGIIGARDNGFGVVGVAPGVRIWGVKVLDSSGNGAWSDVICGLDWVVANAGTIDAVNMSLAGSDTASPAGPCSSSALHQAICNTVNAGVPIAAAAGNSSTDAGATVPAAYAQVVAVSAFTDFNGKPGGGAPPNCSSGGTDDTFATYSNYGSVVAIAAPGTCIYSTLPGGSYGWMTGTSMAAPHVTGAMALYRATHPGASPAAVRSWLLSTAQPQSSSYGFKGGRSGEPVLYLGTGGAPSNPTPTPTPNTPAASPNGAYTIVGSGQSRNSNSGTLAYDGDPTTSWHTTASSPPSSANVWFDLGASKSIGAIKWVFSQTGSADSMKIQVSKTKRTWTTLTTTGNAAANSWQTLNTQTTARYVRFSFTNPNSDPQLGYLGEVQIWPTASASGMAAAAAAIGTPGAVFGSALPVATGPASPATPPAAVQPASPQTAVVANTEGTGARCRTAPSTSADVIAVLPDGTRLPLRGGPVGAWQPVVCAGQSGYVYGSFLTPATGAAGAAGAVGSAAPPAPPATAAATVIATAGAAAATAPGPTPYPIVASAHSANAPAAQVAYDHNPTTVWVTQADTPPATAFAVFDLGDVRPIGTIRWLVGNDGLQGALRLELSEDGETWAALPPPAPGEAVAGTWQEEPAGVTARYVRFALTNPQDDPQLGGLAEVEIWPTDQALPLASLVTPPASTAPPAATVAATATAGTVPAVVTATGTADIPATAPATSPASAGAG